MNKTFIFTAEDIIEAETLKEALEILQERLDNGNLMLDNSMDWNVREVSFNDNKDSNTDRQKVSNDDE